VTDSRVYVTLHESHVATCQERGSGDKRSFNQCPLCRSILITGTCNILVCFIINCKYLQPKNLRLSFTICAKFSLLCDLMIIYVTCFGEEFVNSGGFSMERRINHII